MKMGNRRLKALDRMGTRAINKPTLGPNDPTNRAQRRAQARLKRKSARPKGDGQ